MRLSSRAGWRLAAFLPLLALVAPPVAAQTAPAFGVVTGTGASDPWLYRGSDVPRDPEWVFGKP